MQLAFVSASVRRWAIAWYSSEPIMLRKAWRVGYSTRATRSQESSPNSTRAGRPAKTMRPPALSSSGATAAPYSI
jgi:hypothetical protein